MSCSIGSRSPRLDLVFCDMVTYATSSTFGVIVRGLDVPVVLVALQPMAAMDYANGSTYMQLCNDDFCSVPEFTEWSPHGPAGAAGRAGVMEDDPVAASELGDWCRIARVLHDLRRANRPHGPRAREHARHAH